MMFIGWIAIAVIFYYLFAKKGEAPNRTYSKSPREILDERFVSGEIDEQTYQRMRSVLEER